MSAECGKCGSDIVYPVGTWPVGECPSCSRDEKIVRLEAHLERAESSWVLQVAGLERRAEAAKARLARLERIEEAAREIDRRAMNAIPFEPAIFVALSNALAASEEGESST